MIARLTGVLTRVQEDRVLVECGGLGYEVLIPAATQAILAGKRGETVTLHTLHYLEGGMGAGNPIPRLAGFLTEVEREFAQRFITVKGMGMKAVLKALTAPVDDIARAIEQKNIRTLIALPGIGRRSAEQIIAELNGKVGKYALFRADAEAEAALAAEPELADEVRMVLEQLGYSAAEAESMCARALDGREYASAEEVIQEVFRQQASAPA